ncbi:GNAT family N-acetyltransferase [Alicyclobacillus cellulosilyticus]|uniref:GNAT family N-acetyltransferase n=1 Tax=Alicyclobacillus cellulosilyticus TaxID=1003997 RepID=UPI0016651C92|nr:GNAT family N-acetyltransferase [Alicyclobacillus cellulosilyticus]
MALPWYQDPEVLYYSEGGPSALPYDRDRVERMYRYLLQKGEVFIIEVAIADQWTAIGDVALCPDCLPIVIGDGRYRSIGIGGKVLDLIIALAKSRGWDKLRVNAVYSFNERSRHLYTSRGFAEVKRYVDSEGNECIAMELNFHNTS